MVIWALSPWRPEEQHDNSFSDNHGLHLGVHDRLRTIKVTGYFTDLLLVFLSASLMIPTLISDKSQLANRLHHMVPADSDSIEYAIPFPFTNNDRHVK